MKLIKQTCQSNPEDEEAYPSLKPSVSALSVYCLCRGEKKALALWAKFNMYFSFGKQESSEIVCALKFEFYTFVTTFCILSD